MNCAKAKTKCDHLFPCGRCSARGITCVPRTPRRLAATLNPAGVAISPLGIGASESAVEDSLITHSVSNQIEGSKDPIFREQSEVFEPMEQDDVIPPGQARSRIEQPVSNYSFIERSTNAQQNPPAMATADIPPVDFDLDSFISFGDLDSNGNLDWARFLDPLSPSEIQAQARLSSETPSRVSYMYTDLCGPQVATASTPSQQLNGSESAVGPSLPMSSRSVREITLGQDVNYTSHLPRDYSRSSKTGHDLHSISEYSKSTCLRSPSPRSPPVRFGEMIAHFGRNFGDISTPSAYFDRWRISNFGVHEIFKKVAVEEATRERMLVIMQSFFRWASDLHDQSSTKERRGRPHLPYKSVKRKTNDYLFLPPTPVIHEYLEVFLTNFEPFYPIIPRRTFDPNKLVHDNGENTSTLSLLLMIAYGMMRDERAEYRRLSAGLVTICHSSLKKLVERDTRTPRSNMTFQSALLCTHQLAFSGDKWLTDTAKAHRYLYLGVSDLLY